MDVEPKDTELKAVNFHINNGKYVLKNEKIQVGDILIKYLNTDFTLFDKAINDINKIVEEHKDFSTFFWFSLIKKFGETLGTLFWNEYMYIYNERNTIIDIPIKMKALEWGCYKTVALENAVSIDIAVGSLSIKTDLESKSNHEKNTLINLREKMYQKYFAQNQSIKIFFEGITRIIKANISLYRATFQLYTKGDKQKFLEIYNNDFSESEIGYIIEPNINYEKETFSPTERYSIKRIHIFGWFDVFQINNTKGRERKPIIKQCQHYNCTDFFIARDKRLTRCDKCKNKRSSHFNHKAKEIYANDKGNQEKKYKRYLDYWQYALEPEDENLKRQMQKIINKLKKTFKVWQDKAEKYRDECIEGNITIENYKQELNNIKEWDNTFKFLQIKYEEFIDEEIKEEDFIKEINKKSN